MKYRFSARRRAGAQTAGRGFAVRGAGVLVGVAALLGQVSAESGVGLTVAQAQPKNAKADAAEALFRQAQQLGSAGKWAQACEKFAASNALEPGVGTLLYLGDCYEKLDRFASAARTFQEAARLAEARDDTERQHVAAVRAAALQPRAPQLEIRTSEEAIVPGLQVTLNGVPVAEGELNGPLARDEGPYELVVSAPGHETFTSRIELQNGMARAAVVTVPRLVQTQSSVAAAPSRKAQKPSARQGAFWDQSTVGMIIGGAGLALAGTAGVFTAFATSADQDAKAVCNPNDPTRCGVRGVDLNDEAFRMASYATVFAVASGVALATGSYLYFTADGLETGKPEQASVHFAGSFDWF